MGFIFQNLTYTVTVPVYLIIHLLTSPISSPGAEPNMLTVETQDLFLLPFSIIVSFIVPTAMMALPSPSMVAPSAHYTWLAIWQIFPVAQSVSHSLYKRITAPINFKQDSHEQIDDLYRFVSLLAFIPQTALLALAVTPAHAVPDMVVSLVPGLTRQSFEQVDLATAFVPYWPWDSPQAVLSAKTVKAEGLVELVKMFLQWDTYCGGLAILAWSAFVYSVARPEKRFLSSVLPRIIVWTVFGGPVGAAAMLLWERDSSARRQPTETASEPMGTDQKWSIFSS